MSDHSKIEWTDATWNPIRGCTKISPGCTHCYAETFAERFRGVPGHPYEQGFDLRLVPEKLTEPITWSKPRMVFVNSMSDLFHEGVDDDYILRVARVMAAANWHVYQVLTKRSERLRDLLRTKLGFAARLPHIWWGVSVEDRRFGLPRIEHLRQADAAVAFLSIEPLLEDLGPLDLREPPGTVPFCAVGGAKGDCPPLRGRSSGIDWVIVGGESGHGARPLEKDWVLRILQSCRAAEVPFFFKQWGGVQKSKAGRHLDGRTYDELPPILRGPVPGPQERRELQNKFQPGSQGVARTNHRIPSRGKE